MNLSGRDPFVGVSLTGNLAQVAKVFAKGYHRCAIVDASHGSAVVGIITHSTILRVLLDNIGILGELADEAVGRLLPTGDGLVTCV